MTNRSSRCREGGGEEAGARGVEADLENYETIYDALCTQMISQRVACIEMDEPTISGVIISSAGYWPFEPAMYVHKNAIIPDV